MNEDDLSDAEFEQIMDLIMADVHPIQIARRMHKPVKEVHDFWVNVIDGWTHNELELPPRVAESRARKAKPVPTIGGVE
jgi:hypothetical protein